MEMEFNVKITKSDLYDYLLYHAYTSASGLFGSIAGALLIIAFTRNTEQVILLLMGLFLLVYFPWTLNISAAKQASQPAFKEPLHYLMNEEGMTISIGDQSQLVEWSTFTRSTATRKSILLFTSKKNAYIFPRRELGDRTSDLIEMISTHMDPAKVKIRGAI